MAQKQKRLSPKEVLLRSDAAWKERDVWKPILQEAYELAAAGRNPYVTVNGARPMEKQFDATAPTSTIKLTNRILTDVTPPDKNWVDVDIGPLLKMKYTKEQLQEFKPHLDGASEMANLVVNSGNAVQARFETFLDLIISGLGAMLTMDDPDDDIEPVIFSSVSQSEIAIEDDAKGYLAGVYRKRTGLRVREIESIWPDAKIPEEITRMIAAAKGKSDPEIEVLEATYRSGKGKDQVWNYEVLWNQGSGKDPVRMVEREYAVNPWSIWRWMKLPGHAYGPGPVLLGIADIRTANAVVEMILLNAAISLAGIYLAADDGVLNPDNVMLKPGAIIPVQSTGGNLGASLAPLQTGRSFEVGNIVLKQLQDAIKKHLYDTSLPPFGTGQTSATEMIERISEANRDIGGGIGRMTSDTVQWVRRILEILTRRGMVPKLPYDQLTFKVQINAPLARAQKMSEVQNVVQWMQLAAAVGGPQIATLVTRAEEIIVWMADQMAIPSELLRTAIEKKDLDQKIAGILASQQAASMGSQPGSTMTA